MRGRLASVGDTCSTTCKMVKICKRVKSKGRARLMRRKRRILTDRPPAELEEPAAGEALKDDIILSDPRVPILKPLSVGDLCKKKIVCQNAHTNSYSQG